MHLIKGCATNVVQPFLHGCESHCSHGPSICVFFHKNSFNKKKLVYLQRISYAQKCA